MRYVSLDKLSLAQPCLSANPYHSLASALWYAYRDRANRVNRFGLSSCPYHTLTNSLWYGF